jgi:hypothetical protein
MTANVKKTRNHFNEKMRAVDAHSLIYNQTLVSGLHS